MFFVKKFSKVLLIITFALFVAGSAQSISADHLESNGKGIFTDQNDVNLVSDNGSKFQLHIQVVVRDAQGQLVSVLETSGGEYLRHELTDGIFEYRMGEKEIITIDGVKYEKAMLTDTPTIEQRLVGLYPIFTETPMEINIEIIETSGMACSLEISLLRRFQRTWASMCTYFFNPYSNRIARRE